MENINRNVLDIPRELLPEYKGKQILGVISKVIGENPGDDGYMCVMENGEKELVPTKVLDSIASPVENEPTSPEEKELKDSPIL